MGPATTAFVEWFVFVITCLVCFTSFIMAIKLAVVYLRTGRPIGAPYVFMPVSSAISVIRKDEESQQEAFRSEFDDDIKSSEGGCQCIPYV